MSIIRAPRPESSFYILNKAISEDKRLGWAARGLLIYLLGKPDNWNVSVQALVNETAESSERSARDRTYSIIGQLIESGYITRIQSKNDDGRFAGYDYIVGEIPKKECPSSDDPYTDLPSTVETTLISTDLKQGLNKTILVDAERQPEQPAEIPESKPVRKKPSMPACPYDEIVDLYYEILPELPAIVILNETRKRHLQSRWRENEVHRDLDFWREYFSMVKASPFLTGKTPGRMGAKPFRATFDWLINASNFVKVIEGNYNA